MGYYIETPGDHGKAGYLLGNIEGAEEFNGSRFTDVPDGRVAVCVVSNGFFEAAGITYDEQEFQAFADPRDIRPKRWLTLPKEKAIELNPHVASVLA